MNKAKFYYKPESIDKLAPRTEKEARRILEPLVPKECRTEKDMAFVMNLMTADIDPSPYAIHAFVPITTKLYDWFTYNFLRDHEIVSTHKGIMRETDGIVNCICVYAKDRPDALLLNSEGYDYARYVAEVPFAEVLS